jgi:predicted kinase
VQRTELAASTPARAQGARPILVATGGLVASGKSTLARAAAALLGVAPLEADALREALLGRHPGDRAHEAAWARSFADGFTDEIYAALLGRARAELGRGRPVVLDGCFASSRSRAAARALAEEAGVPFLFLECRAASHVVRERLARRSREQGVAAADWLALEQALHASFEPVHELSASEHRVLDSGEPLESTLRALREILAERTASQPRPSEETR